jgi:DNA primase
MRFPPEFLDELRDRLSVSEVVGRRVSLKKAGREWKGLSPFNKEKTPSFFVNDQKRAWFDFSSGRNGNIFDFVMLTEGLSFPEAVEHLAGMAGMPLPTVSRNEELREKKRKTLHEVMELAAKFFEATLASRSGATARGYLADRGIELATQAEFRIGYAPAGRYTLKEHLGSLGIPVSDMVETGLLIAGDDIPVPYDRFRDRIIIPIQDGRGRIVAFGGRALNKEAQPKYLNSPETTLFHKGSTLFNLHRARQTAHEDGNVVAVEGYMDAIAIYQAGLKSVVATMGTSFTEEQITALWRVSPEPIVCFDSDHAGIAAAYRSIDRILPVLRVGRTFRFAFIRGQKDPDELIRESGIDAFRNVLSGSLPLWDVLWEREVATARLDSAGDQAVLEQKLSSIVRSIVDPEVKRSYQHICRLELARLFWQVLKSKRARQQSKLTISISKEGSLTGIRQILFGLLVHYPSLLEDRSDAISRLEINDPRLGEFRRALFLLLLHERELSVQLIYDRLGEDFYDVLDEIHGYRSGEKPRGHKLFQRFPIVKIDPPFDFIARCVDHFIRMLELAQMAAEIEEITSAKGEAGQNDDAGLRALSLIRDYQLQEERIRVEDSALAEEASQIKRVLGAAAYRVAA